MIKTTNLTNAIMHHTTKDIIRMGTTPSHGFPSRDFISPFACFLLHLIPLYKLCFSKLWPFCFFLCKINSTHAIAPCDTTSSAFL